MMNFNLSQIPDRNKKPRASGITMVMDKGLSVNEAKNFLSVSHPHVDIIKLGFGTSFVTPNLEEKLKVYRSYDLPIYFGGTLFEAFLIRNQLGLELSVDPGCPVVAPIRICLPLWGNGEEGKSAK